MGVAGGIPRVEELLGPHIGHSGQQCVRAPYRLLPPPRLHGLYRGYRGTICTHYVALREEGIWRVSKGSRMGSY